MNKWLDLAIDAALSWFVIGVPMAVLGAPWWAIWPAVYIVFSLYRHHALITR